MTRDEAREQIVDDMIRVLGALGQGERPSDDRPALIGGRDHTRHRRHHRPRRRRALCQPLPVRPRRWLVTVAQDRAWRAAVSGS